MRWHRLAFKCPRCGKLPIILAVSAAADSETLVDLFCMVCQTLFAWKSDALQMAMNAYEIDKQEDAEAPQIFDTAFMKACHIQESVDIKLIGDGQ